jgi:hypothetical protein
MPHALLVLRAQEVLDQEHVQQPLLEIQVCSQAQPPADRVTLEIPERLFFLVKIWACTRRERVLKVKAQLQPKLLQMLQLQLRFLSFRKLQL